MPKRVIMIHGWEGYPEEGWRPWLRKELEPRGFTVSIPAMPETQLPQMEKWVAYLSETIGIPDEQTYLVGHSLGAITILRYFESLKNKQIIGGAIFISGFSYDLEYAGYNHELASFFKTPVDWKKIKLHCPKFTVIHSTDDKWVPVKHAMLLTEKLHAKKIIQTDMKHYGGDDGIFELPIVLNELLAISS